MIDKFLRNLWWAFQNDPILQIATFTFAVLNVAMFVMRIVIYVFGTT